MRHRHTCLLVCGLLVVTGCGRSTETTTDRSVVDKQSADALSNSVSPAPDTSEPTSPQQQFEAIKAEYDEAYATFLNVYRGAQDDKAKEDASAARPEFDDYVGRLVEIVDRYPQSEAAVDALIWISHNSRSAESNAATQKLLGSYSSNPKVAGEILLMSGNPNDGAEEQLRGLLEAESEPLQAAARYTLGTMLIKQDHESEEAIALLQSVVDDFADVEILLGNRGIKIAPRAAGELIEATKLNIGMVVPEIEGTDLDGVDFKLSDYRGKVVVLDFWGDW
jgi:hypothetical protein